MIKNKYITETNSHKAILKCLWHNMKFKNPQNCLYSMIILTGGGPLCTGKKELENGMENF